MYRGLVDIIVPCYNEAEVVDLFYEKTNACIKNIDGYKFDFIFIDDGSTDETLLKLNNIAEHDKNVFYISFSKNFGKESGIYAGLKASSGDFAIIMDADLQNPPEQISIMLNAAEEGYDSCVACRNRVGDSKIRSAFARMFYKIVNKISDVEMRDGAGDFRLLSRKMINAVLSMSEVQRFSKGIFSWVGFKTKWIYFENRKRAAGESKWSFFKLFKYALEGITAFSTAPLRVATVLGVFFSFVSFVMMTYIAIKTIAFGKDLPGYASTICILLFIGGVMMMSLGILGEYIAKIYTEVKNRPIYIVNSTNLNEKKEVGRNEYEKNSKNSVDNGE